MKHDTRQRIDDTTHYEAYFDLWGYSPGWINTICDALFDFSDGEKGDTAECYRNEACMAFRFTSTSRKRREQAKAVFRKLEPLARRTLDHNCYYHIPCA